MPLKHRSLGRVSSRILTTLALVSGLQLAAHAQAPSVGQTVYVPIYSSVVYGEPDRKGEAPSIPFANLLSIRNTDIKNSITIRSVRYHDANGKMLREETSAQRVLAPLASTNVFVSQRDTSAGNGGSFIIRWEADAPANPPIIEGLNIFSLGTKMGIFVSRGEPIRDGQPSK